MRLPRETLPSLRGIIADSRWPNGDLGRLGRQPTRPWRRDLY